MPHNNLLSIIIPTLPERKNLFDAQCKRIKRLCPDAVILSDDSPPPKTIGQKRGELLAKCKTEYVMHIDDDDVISDDMFDLIIPILENEHPDAVAFKEAQYWHGEFKQVASLGCYDGTEKEMGIIHRNPIKTSIARRIGFYDNKTQQEDTIFGYELKHSGLLKHVSVIDKVLYYYYDEHNKKQPLMLKTNGDPSILGPRCENFFNGKKFGKQKQGEDNMDAKVENKMQKQNEQLINGLQHVLLECCITEANGTSIPAVALINLFQNVKNSITKVEKMENDVD